MAEKKKSSSTKSKTPAKVPQYYRGTERWRNSTDQFTCCLCSKRKLRLSLFWATPDKAFATTTPGASAGRALFCKECTNVLYDTFKDDESTHDPFKALYRLCAILGVYYSDALAREIYESPLIDKRDFVNAYMEKLQGDPELRMRVFWYSDDVDYEMLVARQMGKKLVVANEEGEPVGDANAPLVNLPSTEVVGLSDKDKRNRRAVIACFHYDPLANEPIEDRPKLYEDLLTMIEEGMENDLVRQRAALEIVLAFNRIAKANDMLSKLQRTPEDIVAHAEEIKALMAQKKADTAIVSSFSKDNGFTERYAVSKSKGTGTLSAIVRDMQDYGYDYGIANKFDIETAGAMQQVADISAESIFKQVGFSSADYADMVKEQAVIIRDMQDTMARQAEELRVLREKHLKEELMDELKKDLLDKEIDPEEVEELVKQELKYKPYGAIDEEAVYYDGSEGAEAETKESPSENT